MLAIARVRVWLKERDDQGIATYRPANIQRLWKHVVANFEEWGESGCQVMYITHRDMREDISLFVSGKDMNQMSKFALDYLTPIPYVRSIRFIPLMHPRFFPVPKGTFADHKRYTVSVSCEPRALTKVYDRLSRYKATESVVPNYVAYTMAGPSGDILVSYSCVGESTLRKFVELYISPLEGVKNVRITRISRTKRLVSVQEWRYLFEEYVPENPIEIEQINDYEEDQISAC